MTSVTTTSAVSEPVCAPTLFSSGGLVALPPASLSVTESPAARLVCGCLISHLAPGGCSMMSCPQTATFLRRWRWRCFWLRQDTNRTQDGVVAGRKIQSPNIDHLATHGVMRKRCRPEPPPIATGIDAAFHGRVSHGVRGLLSYYYSLNRADFSANVGMGGGPYR